MIAERSMRLMLHLATIPERTVAFLVIFNDALD